MIFLYVFGSVAGCCELRVSLCTSLSFAFSLLSFTLEVPIGIRVCFRFGIRVCYIIGTLYHSLFFVQVAFQDSLSFAPCRPVADA